MGDRGLSGDQGPADDLTWREQDVLALLADRLTNREIAERLHLAESTVKDYVGRVLSKLYVRNRRQAVERAKALGLLGPGGQTAAPFSAEGDRFNPSGGLVRSAPIGLRMCA